MNILIITQKVNKDDQVLGFFHKWIEEFSKNVNSVKVICLEKGEYNFSDNVKVYSLGKEHGSTRIKRIYLYYKHIWNLRKQYDVVFVHMNPIYLCVSGFLFIVLRKPAFLWYTHKNVDINLRVAVFFARKVFTASNESLRIKTQKKIVTGHGIDTEKFNIGINPLNNQTLITVSRLSETKSIDKIIDIADKLNEFRLDIVGAPITDRDIDYVKKINILVSDRKLTEKIVFSGPVSQEDLPNKYAQFKVFINMSNTGSLDKAVLEAMSCGLQVITTNEAFNKLPGVNFISRHASGSDDQIIVDKTKEASLLGLNVEGRDYVVKNHGIQELIQRLVKHMNSKV